MNVISIVGRLTRDPETKTTHGGTEITEFSVAVNGAGKDKETSFFRCKAFGKTGEIVDRYCAKGREIAVTGRMEQRKWEDRDGNNRETWELIVATVTLIGGVRDDAPAKTEAEATEAEAGDFDPFED